MRAQGVFLEHDAVGGVISVKERDEVRIYALLAREQDAGTKVVIESAPARVSDLVSGVPIIVFWRPDDRDRTRRVAHRIEVPAIPKPNGDDPP